MICLHYQMKYLVNIELVWLLPLGLIVGEVVGFATAVKIKQEKIYLGQ